MIEIDIKNIGYRNKNVLSDVRMTLRDDRFTVILGRNGCGKSTLMSAIASIVPYVGTISADGADVSRMNRRDRARKISLMPQMFRTPHITAWELILFGRRPYLSLYGEITDEDMSVVERAIQATDIYGLLNSYVDEISGGEVRRVWFAMILAQDTPNVLLDESTAFMDADHERKFVALAASLKNHGKCVAAVMHSLNLALEFADDVVVIGNGSVVFSGGVNDLLDTDLIEREFSVRRYETGGRTLFY